MKTDLYGFLLYCHTHVMTAGHKLNDVCTWQSNHLEAREWEVECHDTVGNSANCYCGCMWDEPRMAALSTAQSSAVLVQSAKSSLALRAIASLV